MPQDPTGASTREFQQPDSIGSSNSSKTAKIEKKQSTRCIRSPLPQNIARQQSTTNVHHRQYVLLRDKNPINNTGLISVPSSITLPDNLSNPHSPQLNPQQSQSSLVPNKPRPYLRKQPSTKYVFSVDDNEDEIEQDLTREYLEGYNDGLRQRFKPPTNVGVPSNDKKKDLESDVFNSLKKATQTLKDLKDLEVDSVHQSSETYEDVPDENVDDSHISINFNNNNNNNNDDDDDTSDINDNITNKNNTKINNTSNNNNADNDTFNSNTINNNLDHNHILTNDVEQDEDYDDDEASIMSNESFTLKERQVAINETHPFGIRIWKPAVYKKDRSVQKEAELDVHAIPSAKPNIGYSVIFFNFIWKYTFGMFLFLICYLLGTTTFLASIFFNPRTNDSIKYAKFYWNLGNYILYPFGKIVILKADQNYINEDANVGSSVDEFARWRSQNQGKLFFSSSTRSHNHNSDPESQISSSLPSPMTSTNLRETTPDSELGVDDENTTFYRKRYFGRGEWNIGRIIFYFQYYLILAPIGFVIAMLTWLSIFCIPISKVLIIMASHIRRHPLALSFENDQYYIKQLANPENNESFLILTYRSFGLHYYKYTVDGTNIFFINLNVLVIFTIFDFYFFKETLHWDSFFVNSTFIFGLCLISIIPLAYFIGQAVASISAQTSMGLGAVINAFFSTIVEVYLYCIALDQSKAKLVEGSLIGSILGGVLLLPGGSMCFGAIKRKTQRYNPASAGVSSTMLLYAIIVMLSPTILYEIYGEYKVTCQACDNAFVEDCKNCHYYQPSVVIDPLYINYLRPFTIICALSLFLVYCICLLFTLKTHAALIWSNPITSKDKKLESTPIMNANQQSEVQSINSFNLNEQSLTLNNSTATSRPSKLNLNSLNSDTNILSTQKSQQLQTQLQQQQQDQQQTQSHLQSQQIVESSNGHDAPNWSRTKSTTILLTATLLYAIIAEILVDCVDDVLKSISIDPKFLGLTIFALVPNTTEFVNAFSFAIHGNVALSMEIGSAYALQVCLLQIPIVVLYSVWNFTKEYADGSEILVTKAVSGDWNGLPRLSQLLGLSSKKIIESDIIQAPIEAAISGTFGILEAISVRDTMNIGVDKIFSLIFPHWDFVASLFGVYMFTYIYTEGKSNYFKGSILIFLYLVLISGFFIALKIDSSSSNNLNAYELYGGGRVWNRN
jgi:Ca2+:H+ antiporter